MVGSYKVFCLLRRTTVVRNGTIYISKRCYIVLLEWNPCHQNLKIAPQHSSLTFLRFQF